MYESQMSRMKRKIAQQEAIMTKQRKQMDNIKFYLKEKGDDYERDDLQGEIVFQTDKIKRKLQLASLENLIRETIHHEKGQKVSDRCQSSFCEGIHPSVKSLGVNSLSISCFWGKGEERSEKGRERKKRNLPFSPNPSPLPHLKSAPP